ncbi:MAG TPA: hypothetical protein VHZ28_08440 [Terracidiphilus sp.]|nr:hypothetical protein [Terracidiphilus sp.]
MNHGLVKRKKRLYASLALAAAAGLAWGMFSPAAAAGILSRHRKADTADPPQKQAPSASQPPAFSIPVEPLGFYSPGPYYMGQREALVSLDFLDENRLLFTFRAPGLMRRSSVEDSQREIRAEVIALPQGSIETEALWTLHDHDRYLWVLHSGHFLLRDDNTIKEGDSKLELRPLLEFPGPLLSIEMDPGQHYLVTNSFEPSNVKAQQGQVASPATAEADVHMDHEGETEKKDTVLRILDRASGQVMLVSRVRAPVRVPINSDGYVETLSGPSPNKNWVLSFDSFKGGSKVLGNVDSSCQPPVAFAAQDAVVINACVFGNGRRLIAMSTGGHKLWESPSSATQIWPILVMAPNGSLVARETLTVDHSIEDFGHSLAQQDIKGQLVEVFDARGGKLLLRANANPVLDGGGNVAISPSGKRVAILNSGAIEVYEMADRPVPSEPGSQKR